MPSFIQKLPRLSRDRDALLRGAAIILGLFFIASTALASKGTEASLYILIMTNVSVGGFIWFTIIAKLGGIRRILEMRMLYATVAFVLGIYSAITTGMTIRWYESISGFQENGEFLNDIIYYVFRVGLQEETIKMLFILPLVPFILRRRSEAEMLLISSCVGLGFAVEENIAYFFTENGSSLPRLLTANFLHIAMTGSIGLALFRFLRWPKSRWEEFILTFIAIFVLHGLYNAFISVSNISNYSIISLIILGALGHRHFDLIASTREPAPQKISPLGVLIIGSAVMIGLTWVIARSFSDWQTSLQVTGSSTLSFAMIAFLYINRLRSE